MLFIRCSICFLYFFGHLHLSAQTTQELADRTIVVINRNDPDSYEIGHYYALKRGIPESNIVELDTSLSETITIKQYVETVANPLLNVLLDKKWVKGIKNASKDAYGRDRLSITVHRISYVVLIKGIPLRISNDPIQIKESSESVPSQFLVNQCSLDGEISLLLAPPHLSMTAFINNPYFNNINISETDANRILKLTRLDGPTKNDVIRLVDRTIQAEEIGLMGRTYFDIGGPHKRGDSWIGEAGKITEEAYFDVDYETTKGKIDYTDRLDAPAIYMGWYNQNAYAQWSEARWQVPPGAIGFHLHSFSATSVRNTKTWLGAFVSQGYCVCFGNVFEPYLEYTHRPQILLRHLMAGGNFGDAVMLSTPMLSWQNVAIGDPLYRPFKVPLSEQIKSFNNTIFGSYAIIREMNRLIEEESKDAAIVYGRSKFEIKPSLALSYKLANLYVDTNQSAEAVKILKYIRLLTQFSLDELVLAQNIADLLNKYGDNQLALNVYKNLLKERELSDALLASLYERGSKVAKDCGDITLAGRWSVKARNMNRPLSENAKNKD